MTISRMVRDGAGGVQRGQLPCPPAPIFRLEIKLPEASPSLNRTRLMHWAKEHKEKQRWLWMVKSILGPTVIERSQAKGARRLTLERFGVRPVDADNLAGGAKGLIDALKQLGLLVNDDPRSMELVVRNGVRPKGAAPWTRLILEDLNENA